MQKTILKIPLYINVHPVVYEFFYSRYHTDAIEITPSDSFSIRIKTILQLQPKKYIKFPFEKGKTLTLLLPKQFRLGENKKIDTIYRNYLDDRRQYLISRELQKLFKEIFSKYILAFCRGNKMKRGSQKNAINDFCEVYNIKLDAINFEMLKKTWDRSYEKQYLYKNVSDSMSCIN